MPLGDQTQLPDQSVTQLPDATGLEEDVTRLAEPPARVSGPAPVPLRGVDRSALESRGWREESCRRRHDWKTCNAINRRRGCNEPTLSPSYQVRLLVNQ